MAQAANGDDLTFTVDNDTVMVGTATVSTKDVEAANGIIHVIDKVLMPPADEPNLQNQPAMKSSVLVPPDLLMTDHRSRLKSVKPYAGSGKTLT